MPADIDWARLLLWNITLPYHAADHCLVPTTLTEQLLHGAMADLQDEVELVGEDPASMDSYAASDPVERFAVLSEYFFSSLELLAWRFVDLYGCFVRFYCQDPLSRLTALRAGRMQDAGSMTQVPD